MAAAAEEEEMGLQSRSEKAQGLALMLVLLQSGEIDRFFPPSASRRRGQRRFQAKAAAQLQHQRANIKLSARDEREEETEPPTDSDCYIIQ